MTDSVFIDTLSDKTIGVYIGAGDLVGTAKTARELHKVINRNKIDLHMRDIFLWQTVATEVGFDNDDDARKIFFEIRASG